MFTNIDDINPMRFFCINAICERLICVAMIFESSLKKEKFQLQQEIKVIQKENEELKMKNDHLLNENKHI